MRTKLTALLSAGAIIGIGLMATSCNREYRMPIPATAASNTHCFWAADWGVHIALEVRAGDPIPTKINVFHDYHMAMMSSKVGYGEVHVYPLHYQDVEEQSTRLTEVKCQRLPH